jgi:hypothetical protein
MAGGQGLCLLASTSNRAGAISAPVTEGSDGPPGRKKWGAGGVHDRGRIRSWQVDSRRGPRPEMRKDVREFIRRLAAVGLTVESTPGHYRVLHEGKPLRKANGMPFTLFSPDTIRWRRAAIVELRKLGINLYLEGHKCRSPRPFGHRASTARRSHPTPAPVKQDVRSALGEPGSAALRRNSGPLGGQWFARV